MPQNNEPQSSPLILILVIGGILLWWSNTGSKPDVTTPPKPDDQTEVKPVPVPVAEPTEADYWNAIAICVDKTAFGALQQHTDHLLSIVDILKTTGAIKDDSRVAGWRAKRIEITDANRAEVAKQLRGQ
jgi:hypothetical protein